MSDTFLDLSKAKFSTTDDLSDVDRSAGGSSRTLSDGTVVSVEADAGRPASFVVKDASGKSLKTFDVSANDPQGASLCWLCYTTADGVYTCVRVKCVPVTIEPV